MSFLTGKKAKSSSDNQAYGWAKETFGESSGGAYNGAVNTLGNLLGVNGGEASGEALDNYWKSAGGQFQLDQGLDAVNGKFASMGLSRSGSAMKGMENYRQSLASTFLNNYLGQLGNLGQLGLGGGGLVVNAGQRSSSTGGTPGLGGIIGGGLSALASGGAFGAGGLFGGGGAAPLSTGFSDERLKTDIIPTGREIGGVPEVEFTYRQDKGVALPEGRFVGVIAQDVARLRPDALGDERQGFMTVRYDRLTA